MKNKPIIITYRKLGREQAHGLAYKEDREIVIDNRLKGIELLETIVHEALHIQHPRFAEIKIIGHSKELAELLWKQGYRKIDI